MNAPAPKTVSEYLEQLRRALAGSDPALVQDALYDAEEYLRAELAENPAQDEATVLASIAGSYGDPEEVADIYRQTETTVAKALQPPPRKPQRSTAGRFFGVLIDSRAYTSLFYMLLSLVTGILYFTWVVTGMSLSLGLSILIIGIPVAILFFASVRGIALFEGRLVEALLGERMPRRPTYQVKNKDVPALERIKTLFTDPRSWSSMIYMLLMQPLGAAYFAFAVGLLAVSFGIAAIPIVDQFNDHGTISIGNWYFTAPWWSFPVFLGVAILVFAIGLHIARGVGYVHAQLAKSLLVKSARL